MPNTNEDQDPNILTNDDNVEAQDVVNDDHKSSKEYIDQLKKDAAKWRNRAKENKEYEKKFKDSEARLKDAETKADTAMQQVAAFKTVAEKRMIDAELRALATEYGLKKMDYVKLGDKDAIKIDDNGNVTGAREMMESLKNTDPDLFKLPTTTNIHYTNRNETVEKVKQDKKVLNLSREDYEKEEREFLKKIRS